MKNDDSSADALRDDLPGLIDLTLHRLLELTECDYIAIHSVDGDHQLLYPGEGLETCPHRCEECSFYKLMIPQPGESKQEWGTVR